MQRDSKYGFEKFMSFRNFGYEAGILCGRYWRISRIPSGAYRFLKHIPEGLNAAFVVVTHLMRDRRSHLSEILSSHSSAGYPRGTRHYDAARYIYVLIEDTYLTCKEHVLQVQPSEPGYVNLAADVFLESLAQDFGSRAIAIILSGGGSDGLNGAKAIEKAGGRVMVQDPASAQVDGMPTAVIKFDHPTEILDPAGLARVFPDLLVAGNARG
jgi:chemotaxis response regulator CheB